MFSLSCLSRPSASSGPLLLAEGFHFTLVAILLMALIGAALAAPLVQRGYRKRVIRLMRFNQVAPRPSQWWSSSAAVADPSINIAEARSVSAGTLSDLVRLLALDPQTLVGLLAVGIAVRGVISHDAS